MSHVNCSDTFWTVAKYIPDGQKTITPSIGRLGRAANVRYLVQLAGAPFWPQRRGRGPARTKSGAPLPFRLADQWHERKHEGQSTSNNKRILIDFLVLVLGAKRCATSEAARHGEEN